MKKLLKLLCLTLVMAVLTFNTTGFAMEQNSSTISNDKTLIGQTLNTYFDLQFKSVECKTPNKINQLKDVIETNINSGKQIYDYETGKAKFLIASHACDNTIIENYNFNAVYTSLEINDDHATAYITLDSNIKYNFMQDIDHEYDSHEISLVKEKGQWLIYNDVYSNDFSRAFQIGTDFNKLA